MYEVVWHVSLFWVVWTQFYYSLNIFTTIRLVWPKSDQSLTSLTKFLPDILEIKKQKNSLTTVWLFWPQFDYFDQSLTRNFKKSKKYFDHRFSDSDSKSQKKGKF